MITPSVVEMIRRPSPGVSNDSSRDTSGVRPASKSSASALEMATSCSSIRPRNSFSAER